MMEKDRFPLSVFTGPALMKMGVQVSWEWQKGAKVWDFLFFRKAIEQIIFPPGFFLLLILLIYLKMITLPILLHH